MTTRGHAPDGEGIPSLADTSALREPPATARGARTRAALVAAARVVFERDGYLDSRLTDITAEAACSTGTFYTYFAGKEEIFQAVLEVAQDDMLHPGMPRLDPEDSSPVGVIEASNRAYFEAYKRNAKLMLILDQVAAGDSGFREVRRRRSRAFADRNARAIKDLQDRGLADRDLDPLMAARALSGMVSRMAYYAYGLGEDHTLDELVETSTALWANALKLDRTAE
ncbi:TetR/AcrR family transcriptional regulator [Streptomyces sp. NPDC056121]|uniref:TetR/AcrR family transcriptional regulator n=1 Tax=Streptomyces TaxID=1883 RepID=UPI001D09EF99|nr:MULTISPECIES: TetR/AcrR family transcriptional regulator [Streptomyces]MCX5084768.1 TetR/AcrR family transcriptional regulator [Streptomyces sp. NBC_00401]UDM03942.1 TetR/AcrR family transcriptional regulator [Streptomyces longhuiensis]